MSSFLKKHKYNILFGAAATAVTTAIGAIHPNVATWGSLFVGMIFFISSLEHVQLKNFSPKRSPERKSHRNRAILAGGLCLAFFAGSMGFASYLDRTNNATEEAKKAFISAQTEIAKRTIMDGQPLHASAQTTLDDGRGWFWQKRTKPVSIAFSDPLKDGSVVSLTVSVDGGEPKRELSYLDPRTKKWLSFKAE